MSSTKNQLQKRATATIKQKWREVAGTYTVAWMGPIEMVEAVFPHISDPIEDIRWNISPDLPMIVYQTRTSPPENMSVAVPYVLGSDGYKCRLVSTNDLTRDERSLLGEFAQALWFLIDSNILPSPRVGKGFEQKLVEWTDRSLITL